MRVARPNPLRLVWLAVIGSLMTASVWFLSFIHVPIFAHGCGFWNTVWAYRLRLELFLCPGLVGIA